MRKLVDLVKLMIRADSRAFRNGLALSIVVLAMGAALLGLSGWFVTAAATAGLAGIGIGFDFFRPSAGVRFLALGRSAARYGERLVTHDATLRALAALRVTLLGGIARLPHEAQAQLRGANALNRLTSDVDALDGLMLRLVLPALAAVAVQLGAAVALWMLVAPAVAVAVLTIYLAGGALVLVQSARKARAAAATAEDELQALRAQSLDTLRTRADQVMAGALVARATELRGHVTNEAEARATLDRVERWGNAAVSMTGGLAASAALAIGGYLAEAGAISAARAAIGFFVALALIETLSQLRRGMAELGRMQVAGARVLELAQAPELQVPRPPPAPRPGPLLLARDIRFRRPGATRELFSPVSFSLNRGETIVIGGASGTGKSTLLAALSGLLVPSAGDVLLMGTPLRDWPEDVLRARLTMVPQRPQLIGGTIAENLHLALPEGTAPDEALMHALDAVDLSDTVSARGGLEMRLGEGGTGLSGGQSKRLALARAALRRPTVLLLDEPTEGLDPDTARATLQGLRALLPDSGFVIVSHRGADLEGAGHAVLLRSATD